jgi:hypothetical protein
MASTQRIVDGVPADRWPASTPAANADPQTRLLALVGSRP